MYVREKTINGYTYLYLVESVREGSRTKQRIIKNLGRKEKVVGNGDLERLASSVSRYAEHALVLSAFAKGELSGLECRRIGPPLLFGRLWEATGCRAVIERLLEERAFEFPVERAIFVTVLHRLMVSGSDRSCEQWLVDYAIPESDGLQLHHFYRAMAWLGEELGGGGANRRHAVCTALRQGSDRGAALRAPPRSVHRPLARLPRYHHLVVHGPGRRNLGAVAAIPRITARI